MSQFSLTERGVEIFSRTDWSLLCRLGNHFRHARGQVMAECLPEHWPMSSRNLDVGAELIASVTVLFLSVTEMARDDLEY